MITAKKVYSDLVNMPVKEREKVFALIAKQGFEKEFYRHEEVFDDLRQSPFTLTEAAEYLEVAEITVRRWIKKGELKGRKLGRNIVFDIDDLKTFKRKKDHW